MAPNFKLFLHKTRESIHVKMCGDFDGNSAHELIQALQINGPKACEVFIDTEDLKNISTFGKEVFQNNIGNVKKQSMKLIFIGNNQNKFKL